MGPRKMGYTYQVLCFKWYSLMKLAMQTKASDFLSDAHDIVVARKVELNMSAGIRNANPFLDGVVKTPSHHRTTRTQKRHSAQGSNSRRWGCQKVYFI